MIARVSVLNNNAMSNTKPTIQKLQEELHCVSNKCQDIGIQLNLNDKALRQIEERYPNSHPAQLRQVLRLWLERDDACWDRLIAVLRHPVVNEIELARRLETQYCPQQKQRLPNGSSSTSRPVPEYVQVDQDSPSAATAAPQKGVVAQTKEDSIPKEYFIRTPPSERVCTECDQVPLYPMRSVCCPDLALLCKSCSSTKIHCIVCHNAAVYKLDKQLQRQVSETTVQCTHCKKWKKQARHLSAHLAACPDIPDTTVHSSSVDRPSEAAPGPSTTQQSQPPGPDREEISVNKLQGKKRSLESDQTAGPSPKVPHVHFSEHCPEAEPVVVPNSCEFNMPTHFSEDLFVDPASLNHKCRACMQVPLKAMKTKCCDLVYCKACASNTKTCTIHKREKFVTHTSLNHEISKLQIYCPNRSKGCMWRKPIDQLKGHLLKNCSITCPYSSLGCKQSVTNTSILNHMQESVIEHLNQVRRETASISELRNQLARLESQMDTMCTTPPQLFMICQISTHTSDTSGWTSPSFYSHQLGCKLHLVVWLSVVQSIFNLKVVYDKGLYDDALKWPCKGKITLKITNQQSNTNHCKREVGFTLNKDSSGSSHTFPLQSWMPNTAYVLNDILYLTVEFVSVESQIPWLGPAHGV